MKATILTLAQQKLWEKLTGASWISKFYLAGGTALALQLNHRESIDFDFFSASEFDSGIIAKQLSEIGKIEVLSSEPRTFVCILAAVKISFFHYPYENLSPPEDLNGIAIAGLSDIACMKLVAVAQRGTKKDFIDVYELIGSGMNLTAQFEALERKFSSVSYNKLTILKSLAYFVDAEDDAMPKMLKPYGWAEVKRELRSLCRKQVKGVE